MVGFKYNNLNEKDKSGIKDKGLLRSWYMYCHRGYTCGSKSVDFCFTLFQIMTKSNNINTRLFWNWIETTSDAQEVWFILTTWDWQLISFLYWCGIWAGTMFANCWKYLQFLVNIRKTRTTNSSFSWQCFPSDGMNVELSKSIMFFIGYLSLKSQSITRLS